MNAKDIANMARSLKSYAHAVESMTVDVGKKIADDMRQSANQAAMQATDHVAAQVNKSLQHTGSHLDEFLKVTIDSKSRLIYFADRGANSAEFNVSAFENLMQKMMTKHIEKW